MHLFKNHEYLIIGVGGWGGEGGGPPLPPPGVVEGVINP